MLDHGLARLGDETDQLRRHPLRGVRRSHGGDDLGLGHVLARQGHVGERAVAVQEPFARRVQRRLEVLDVVALRGSPLPDRPRGVAGENHRLLVGLDRRHAMHRRLPGVVQNHDDVIEVVLGQRRQRLDLLRHAHECPLLHVDRLARGRVRGRIQRLHRVEVELVGRACPDRAAAVDEQLLEVDLALGDLGQTDRPDAVGPRLEAPDGLARREDRLRGAGGFVGDRAVGRAAVLGSEDDGLGQSVGALGNAHPDGSGQWPRRLEPAHGVAGAGQRPQRPVGPLGVGDLQLAGPLVVSLRADIEDRFGRRGNRRREQGHGHQRGEKRNAGIHRGASGGGRGGVIEATMRRRLGS